MKLELTEEQQRALGTQQPELPQIVDPTTKTTYVLVPVEQYESICAVLDDERQQKAIRNVALQNAVGRMNDPR